MVAPIAAEAAAQRRLAWIVLAILACVALIGFGQGLFHALGAAPARSPAQDGAAPLSTTGVRAREASALPLLDEARVRQIAREEAEAALGRARPRKPRAVQPSDADDAASSDPAGAPIPAPLATPPAAPADPPFNPQAN